MSVGYAQWSPYAYYELNDIVDYDARTWVCLLGPNIDKQPDASPTFWSQIGGGGGVITTINAGTGITVTGSGVSRTIATNLSAGDGRLTITAGTGTELILTNTCPASLTAGAGLAVSGTNATGLTVALGNVGTAGTYAYPTSVTTDAYGRVSAITAGVAPVTSVVAGTGINVTGTTTPTISNTGVLSVSAGTGISVGGTASNPTITNAGVVGLTAANAGAGIAIGGSSTVPIITNTGVNTITAGSGITIGGTASNPIITATATSSVPLMSRILFNVSPASFFLNPGQTGTIDATLNGTIVSHINSGTAFANNIWVLDYSALILRWNGTITSGDAIQISFTDGTNTYTPNTPTQLVVPIITAFGSDTMGLGQVSFNPNTLKALGFNGATTTIRITNLSTSNSIFLNNIPSVGYATYYPNGY